MKNISCIVTACVLAVSLQTAEAYHTINANIYTEDTTPQLVLIDGANWAGLQNTNEGFAGLWGNISLNTMAQLLTAPWTVNGSGVTQSAAGATIRTIRIPISPQTLRRDWNDPTALSTDKISTVFANVPDIGSATTFQSAYGSYDTNPGVNDANYLVNNDRPDLNAQFKPAVGTHMTQLHELIAFIQVMKQNNIRVIIDFHQNTTGRDQNVTEGNYTLNDYAHDVAFIAQYVKLLGLTNVIGMDVFNEPNNLNWYSAGAAPTGAGMAASWTQVVATAAQAVYNNNPNLLLFVEGPNSNDPANPSLICVNSSAINEPSGSGAYVATNNQGCPSGMGSIALKANWGENFQPLLNVANAKAGTPTADLTAFTNALKQYGMTSTQVTWLLGGTNGQNAHIVFSPHTYGQGVGGWQPHSAAAQAISGDWNYGFLAKAGYAVVIGESGFISGSTTDQPFFINGLSPYLLQKNLNHNLFFWEFPSDSGDTGGLLSGGDSLPLEAVKEQALHNLFSGSATVNGSFAISFVNIPSGLGQSNATVSIDGNVATTTCTIGVGCSLPNVTAGAHSITVATIKNQVSAIEEDDYTLPVQSVTAVQNQSVAVKFTFGSPSNIIKTYTTPVNYQMTGVQTHSSSDSWTVNFVGSLGEQESCVIPSGQFSTICSIVNKEGSTSGQTETFTVTPPNVDGYTVNTTGTNTAISFTGGVASPNSLTGSYTAIPQYPVTVSATVSGTSGVSGQAGINFSNASTGKVYTDMASIGQPNTYNLPAATYNVSAADFTSGGMNYTATAFSPQTKVITVGGGSAAVAVTYQKVQAVSSGCTVKVQLNSPWQQGSAYYNTINLYVSSTTAVNAPWTLTLSGPNYLSASPWNWTTAVSQGKITGTASQSWENLTPGQQVNVGATVSATSNNLMPTQITLNGQICTIQ